MESSKYNLLHKTLIETEKKTKILILEIINWDVKYKIKSKSDFSLVAFISSQRTNTISPGYILGWPLMVE